MLQYQGQTSPGIGQAAHFVYHSSEWFKDPTSSTDSPMGCREEDRREYRNSNGHQTSFPPQSPQAAVLLLRVPGLGANQKGAEDS